MTTTELERGAGVTVGIVTKWANGATPGLDKVGDIVDALGITIDQLLGMVPREEGEQTDDEKLRKTLEVFKEVFPGVNVECKTDGTIRTVI